MSIPLSYTDSFSNRHNGPSQEDVDEMLKVLGKKSLDELIKESVPESILHQKPLALNEPLSEYEFLQRVKEISEENEIYRSFIGMGYYDTITPPVIQRNILENPSWYTQYTPYQAEISQGRLEALLNFQTMVIDLTGLDIANASLLDEGTAAAEAMMMFSRLSKKGDKNLFFIDEKCHPQTIDVVVTRAEPLGIEVVVGDYKTYDPPEGLFGVLLQYPATDGCIEDYSAFCDKVHEQKGYVAVATDLLALTVLTPPASFGADAAVGNTQRFGVPLGYGGPHAAFFATREAYKRHVPGRIIGVSVDANGHQALRMALQTREQHIRRDKATSNICTAQVLLAVMASMYAVYHGPKGLRAIAERVHNMTRVLAAGLERLGHTVRHNAYFDTLRVDVRDSKVDEVRSAADHNLINLRFFEDDSVGISIDQTVSVEDLDTLFAVFDLNADSEFSAAELAEEIDAGASAVMNRTDSYLEHPVFNSYHSETELMRYIHQLSQKDLSLTTSMIPLGSCTMKLNAASELMPVSWPAFNNIHPFAPESQAQGYKVVIEELKEWLAEITGFADVSLQPNSGASGEYTGLLTIRAYHKSRGQEHRNICVVPQSAHGTNPASAVMAGMKVVIVGSDDHGNIDLDDLKTKVELHQDNLAALMVTYPSTHGVFEEGIRDICQLVHEHGGLVYLDGANMNAQVGLCRPGDYGADVCHLNLHKTFSIPHGGGGPGVGPICVTKELAPFLPGHIMNNGVGGDQAIGAVAAAPYGSASILLISWAYISMMGASGLLDASRLAILNANYVAKRLEGYYPILFKGEKGMVAHEFIMDLRPYKQNAGINEQDVAKRLMDYGYHAPTMSWPVVGTMMVEPTESESKAELDRFCEAMISIRSEIEEIELGMADKELNVLRQAPHTAGMIASDTWEFPYSREKAVFPASWSRSSKFWPSVRRLNDAYGDRNLVCSCPPIHSYAEIESTR
ncbi:MAG: aminomethyl-transferring glycine dehydrogenase [Rhodothermaceae bacterium]|nr:aminomethyl-transferring glycine dehydrogenase [Rhodothermaceae bacterium]